MATMWIIFSIEVIGASLVAWGCFGEFQLIFSKNQPSLKSERRWYSALWRSLRPLGEWVVLMLFRFKLVGHKISAIEEHRRERIYVGMVAVGVTLELIAIPFALGESIGQASKIEEQKGRNLALSKQVIELKAKLNPRTISIEQREKFIRFLKDRPKGPVRVVSNNANSETGSFTMQLRQILDDAGYGITNGKAIEWQLGSFYGQTIGALPKDHDVVLLFYGERTNYSWPGIQFTFKDDGNTDYRFSQDDPRAIPAIISSGFHEIGVKPIVQGGKEGLNPGEWIIFVHDKPQ